MAFPFENSIWNRILNILPYAILIALFASAIYVQRAACEGDIFRMIENLPDIVRPSTTARLRG